MAKDILQFLKEPIKATFLKEDLMAKEFSNGKMVHPTREIIRMIRKMDMASILIGMAKLIREIGRMD